MTDAARREHEALKKKVQPKLSLSLTGSLSRSSVSTPPRHTSGNLTPPVTPPITPSSSFRSSTPTGTSPVYIHLKCAGEGERKADNTEVFGYILAETPYCPSCFHLS